MIVQTIKVNDCTPQTIVIGRRGTYDTLQIAFDLSYLVESYGNGVAVLAVKRSQDESAYPAVTSQEDDLLLWTVSETDTFYVGAGEAQLMWYVDGGLAKTIIYPMVVMKDILMTSEEAPDAYQEWVDSLIAEGAETLQNAQNAAQSASDAETAKDDAVTAKESAENAQEGAEAAQQAAETAVTHYPKIVNSYWYVWTNGEWVNTGVKAEGVDGRGIVSVIGQKTSTVGNVDTYTMTVAYTSGNPDTFTFTVTNGVDGYSPVVTITAITGGHRVTITDETHPTGQSFDVMDGKDSAVLSVAGKTGNVTLDANDVAFSESSTYDEGTIGAELSNQKNAIGEINLSFLASDKGHWVDNNNVVSDNSNLRCSDYVVIPEDAIQIEVANRTTVGSNVYHIRPCVLFYDVNKNLLSKSDNNTDDIVTEQILTTAKYVRFNQSNKSGDLAYVHFVVFSITDANGWYGHYSGAFTQKQTKDTGIKLKAGETYIIKYNKTVTGKITNFRAGDTGNYKLANPWIDTVVFTNGDADGNLSLYNPQSTLDDIDIDVYVFGASAEKVKRVPTKYVVDKNTPYSGQYTSLSRCLIDLKDDHSPKVIEVWEGDYDLFAEYIELYNLGLLNVYTGTTPATDYFDYCVWVPENTHIIGKGIVRLKWMPDPATDSITPVQCQCISPLNVAATATIENVEVYCKNGRYCLHNDGLGKPEFTGAVQKYINVKFYKYNNDTDPVSGLMYGFYHATGFGMDRSMHHIYDNCVFYNESIGRAFYGHSRNAVGGVTLTEAMCGDITLTNCVIQANCGTTGVLCKLGNSSNANLHIPVLFSNCYFGEGWIALQNESSSAQTTYQNAFDVTFVNCGKYKINIADPDNRYPPKSYDNLMPEVSDLSNAIGQKETKTTYTTLSGTTVTQTGEDHVMYLCGELATLSFAAPQTGITAIRFSSGTTPTVATFSGVTWLNGFDPSALEASKTYEINILNGLGCAAWT